MGMYFPGSGYPNDRAFELINTAANLGGGAQNPPYSRADFLAVYTQFNTLVPNAVLDQFVVLANSMVFVDRWGDNWAFAMGLVIAHFATLYLQATPASGANAQTVANAGRTAGLVNSKGVDGLSISYDYSITAGNMKGWDTWKATTFGTQFAGLAKLLGARTSYIW